MRHPMLGGRRCDLRLTRGKKATARAPGRVVLALVPLFPGVLAASSFLLEAVSPLLSVSAQRRNRQNCELTRRHIANVVPLVNVLHRRNWVVLERFSSARWSQSDPWDLTRT
jgi:hypothetical protein